MSSKLKFLAAVGAAALIALLVCAMHKHVAQADLTNASNTDVVSSDAGRIIPSYRHGILVCGMPISDCENIDIPE
jgi:hypothetical protein